MQGMVAFLYKQFAVLYSAVLYSAVLSGSVVSDSLRCYGLWPARLLCPWNSPGKNIGEGCHTLLQEISPIVGMSPHQFSSVAQSCPTLCDPVNHSTQGLPAHHHLPEFTQTHVHRVCDAIQASHPWSSPSARAPNPSQHQSLFQ